MDLVIAQATWRNKRIKSVDITHELLVGAEPEYPYNHRAILMGELWDEVRTYNAAGVLWLTSDIALEPDDIEAMTAAIEAEPAIVHTGLVKLWPVSTGWDRWIWSHRTGTVGNPAATQDEDAPVVYFSIDCVWTPAGLLDRAFPAVRECSFTLIDIKLSECALQARIPAAIVPGCRPKHLHFTKEHHADVRNDPTPRVPADG